MKRQRNNSEDVGDKVRGTKAEGATTRVMSTTMPKKKAKRAIDQKVDVLEEEKKNITGGESSMVGVENSLGNWEDQYWPWLRGSVDEQMSWGSIWLPVWDVDYMGEACGKMFSDVVWDDDIWNLKSIDRIPKP